MVTKLHNPQECQSKCEDTGLSAWGFEKQECRVGHLSDSRIRLWGQKARWRTAVFILWSVDHGCPWCHSKWCMDYTGSFSILLSQCRSLSMVVGHEWCSGSRVLCLTQEVCEALMYWVWCSSPAFMGCGPSLSNWVSPCQKKDLCRSSVQKDVLHGKHSQRDRRKCCWKGPA